MMTIETLIREERIKFGTPDIRIRSASIHRGCCIFVDVPVTLDATLLGHAYIGAVVHTDKKDPTISPRIAADIQRYGFAVEEINCPQWRTAAGAPYLLKLAPDDPHPAKTITTAASIAVKVDYAELYARKLAELVGVKYGAVAL